MKKLIILAMVLIISLGVGVSYGADTTPVVENYAFKNITTATTTYVKAQGGILAGILVNGGTLGAITVSDATSTFSGVTIATITSPVSGQVIPFGIEFTNGLKVVTAANTDITVVYK